MRCRGTFPIGNPVLSTTIKKIKYQYWQMNYLEHFASFWVTSSLGHAVSNRILLIKNNLMSTVQVFLDNLLMRLCLRAFSLSDLALPISKLLSNQENHQRKVCNSVTASKMVIQGFLFGFLDNFMKVLLVCLSVFEFFSSFVILCHVQRIFVFLQPKKTK